MKPPEDSGSFRLPPPMPEHIYEPLKPNVNAMEVFLLVLAMWSGLSSVLVDTENSSAERVLGPTWAIVWACSLFLGGAVALVGIFWKGKGVTAVALQEFGYCTFTVFSIARVIPLVALERYTTAVSIAMFAVAGICRIIQLELRVRRANEKPGLWERWRHS